LEKNDQDLSMRLITMEEYLTTAELSERIKMAKGTIRNLVCRKEFKENIHYLKPTPRKLLFVWSQVHEWMYRNSSRDSANERAQVNSLINI
jgi:hypothetical protein